MDGFDIDHASDECDALIQDYKACQLYIHGIHQDFIAANNISTLEAISGGAVIGLTKMEGDLEYYKALFEKHRFNFIEQDTKEKFLNAFLVDPPLEITLADNQALDAKNVESKSLLEQKAMAIEALSQEVLEAADATCQEQTDLEADIVYMKKMLREMRDMEVELAMLKSVEEKYSGMTIEDAQVLLEEQTQSLYKVNREMEEVSASIQDLKWQESQLQESNQNLVMQSHSKEEEAQEAIRMSALRRPDIEEAYKECLATTRQYQEGVGLESIRYLEESSTLLLEYKIEPGTATVHNLENKSQAGNIARSRKPVTVLFTIKLHPTSGRMLTARVDNSGCDLKDVLNMAMARNDVSFLVSEGLDQIVKAHP
ncbi:hypothetical protein BGZ94_008456 [Podila epigama]|nr:hypothetical protein BGZ94_008456 [Podila epigama]